MARVLTLFSAYDNSASLKGSYSVWATRDPYRKIVADSFSWCIKNKGLIIHAWVIMTNHVHMIISRNGNYLLAEIMRDMKKFTSIKLINEIQNNVDESRKDWMLKFFRKAGESRSGNEKHQFWQQGNHPIELVCNQITEQKLEYLHNNPVKQGIVDEPEYYVWSSAIDYSGKKEL